MPPCRCGVQAAAVAPGDRVAIVGAGPIGLAALQTAALLSPAATFVLDINDARLQVRGRASGACPFCQRSEGQAPCWPEAVKGIYQARLCRYAGSYAVV